MYTVFTKPEFAQSAANHYRFRQPHASLAVASMDKNKKEYPMRKPELTAAIAERTGLTREARDGRNPQTGASIRIPATKTVGFKAGKALKDAIR